MDVNNDAVWERRLRDHKLAAMTPQQRANNPRADPMGHFTGRCSKCGSNNLWDDDMHYGCKSCGAVLS